MQEQETQITELEQQLANKPSQDELTKLQNEVQHLTQHKDHLQQQLQDLQCHCDSLEQQLTQRPAEDALAQHKQEAEHAHQQLQEGLAEASLEDLKVLKEKLANAEDEAASAK